MKKLSTYKEVKEAARKIKEWPLLFKSNSGDDNTPNRWILARGRWNDDGIWIDTETWND